MRPGDQSVRDQIAAAKVGAAHMLPAAATTATQRPKPPIGERDASPLVVLMAGGLIVSVILGVFIACSNARTRPSALVMLVIGMLLPLVVILR